MWELIQSNRRKSIILFIALALCLIGLGYILGAALMPPEGGITGVLIAVVLFVIFSVIALTSGDSILLSASHAKEVTHDVHPRLFNVAEEMKIAANLPVMPRVYVMQCFCDRHKDAGQFDRCYQWIIGKAQS